MSHRPADPKNKTRAGGGAGGSVPPSASRAEIELLRSKVAELVLKNPAKAVIILTDWATRPAGTAPKPSKAKKTA